MGTSQTKFDTPAGCASLLPQSDLRLWVDPVMIDATYALASRILENFQCDLDKEQATIENLADLVLPHGWHQSDFSAVQTLHYLDRVLDDANQRKAMCEGLVQSALIEMNEESERQSIEARRELERATADWEKITNAHGTLRGVVSTVLDNFHTGNFMPQYGGPFTMVNFGANASLNGNVIKIEHSATIPNPQVSHKTLFVKRWHMDNSCCVLTQEEENKTDVFGLVIYGYNGETSGFIKDINGKNVPFTSGNIYLEKSSVLNEKDSKGRPKYASNIVDSKGSPIGTGHARLFKKVFNQEPDAKLTAAGFAFQKGEWKFNSVTFNPEKRRGVGTDVDILDNYHDNSKTCGATEIQHLLPILMVWQNRPTLPRNHAGRTTTDFPIRTVKEDCLFVRGPAHKLIYDDAQRRDTLCDVCNCAIQEKKRDAYTCESCNLDICATCASTTPPDVKSTYTPWFSAKK